MSLGAVRYQGTSYQEHYRSIDDYAGSDGDSDGSDRIIIIGDDDDDDESETEVSQTDGGGSIFDHSAHTDTSRTDNDKIIHQENNLNVLFRRVKNRKLTLVGERFPLVDMQVDSSMEERLMKGEILTGVHQEETAVTFIWNEIDLSALASVTRLGFRVFNVNRDFFSSLYTGLVRDDFAVCRDFVRKMYRTFRSKVVGVIPGSLSFEVIHDDDNSLRSMREASDKVIVDMFKELVVSCTNMAVEAGLDLETTGDVLRWKDVMEEESEKSLRRFEIRAQEQRRSLSDLTEGSAERSMDLRPSSGTPDLDPEQQKMLDMLEAEQDEMNKMLDSILDSIMAKSSSACSISEALESQPQVMNPHQDGKTLLDMLPPQVSTQQTIPKTLQISEQPPSDVPPDTQAQVLKSSEVSTAQTPPKALPLKVQPAPSDITPSANTDRHEKSPEPQPYSPFAPSLQPKQEDGSLESMMEMFGPMDGSDEARAQRLHDAYARNLIDECPVPPRADSHDTILCLDCSQSMEGQAFEDMKRMALKFVDGIEEIAETYGLEENLAIVSISGHADVKQHLTNDYSRIRNAIERLAPRGRTPFFEAIMVCLAALTNCKGRIVNVLGVHQIRPRILFFTDGKPTDESRVTGHDNESGRMAHKMPIIKLVTDLASKDDEATADPIVWIPVGDADRDFLKSLSTLGKGSLADEKDIPSLCRFYRIEDGIGRVFKCVRHDKDRFEGGSSSIVAITEGLVTDLSAEDKKTIVDAVTEKLRNQKVEKKPDDFDDIHEDLRFFPPLGSRVIRGPDWEWKNQDTEGAGTIINHNTLDKWLWVKWDNGEQNCYRYGNRGAYDVLVVDDHPLIPQPGDIPIGIRVTRGPDWRYGDDDGGSGNTGVVIRKKGKTHVKVRWDNGSIKPYTYGQDGIYELTVNDPSVSPPSQAVPEYLEPEMRKSRDTGTLRVMTGDNMVWQWQDEHGQWRLYSDKDQSKINKTYERKQNGSCLISRRGETFRVLLGQSVERAIDGDTRHNIRLTGLSDEELKIAKSTEAFLSE